ncbi:hypothetical protein V6N13_087393 [Hibiscus sabdariffa]
MLRHQVDHFAASTVHQYVQSMEMLAGKRVEVGTKLGAYMRTFSGSQTSGGNGRRSCPYSREGSLQCICKSGERAQLWKLFTFSGLSE